MMHPLNSQWSASILTLHRKSHSLAALHTNWRINCKLREKGYIFFFSFTINIVEEKIKHPTEMCPYFSIWLGSISQFLINHELFPSPDLPVFIVTKLVWVPEFGSLYVCFQAQWHWPKSFFHGFGLPGLAGPNWAPAPASLNFLDHRKSKDGTRPSRGNPPAHTGVEREGCLLAQSRHITSLKIVPSSENSSLIWSLMAPWCNGSDSHKRLCAWMSIHIKCNN